MIKTFSMFGVIVALLIGGVQTGAQSAKPAQSKSVHKHSKHRRPQKGAWKRHGQQRIDSARAAQIQQALIREKYLDGSATGAWDARTEAAMARYQADNGWQSKVTPDSRALIKLGLGPNHQSDLQNLDSRTSPDALASTGSSSSSGTSGAKPR